MDMIRQFLSNEDYQSNVVSEHEIPEVEEVPEEERMVAEAHLVEVEKEEAVTERFYSEANSTDVEVEEHVESLEGFRDILTHGLENEQFSKQFAAAVGLKLETIRTISSGPVTSLEDYKAGNLKEFYSEALVSIEDHVNDVSGIKTNITDRLVGSLVDASVKASRAKTATSLTKSADAALAKLADVETGKKVSVSLTGLAPKLAVAGSLPTQIVAAANADQKAMSNVFDGYFKGAVKHHGELHRIIEKASKTTDIGGVQNLAKEMLALKRPEDALDQSVTSGKGLLGNVYVDVDSPKGDDADADVAAKLKQLRKRSAPKYISFKKKPEGGEITLGKDDVEKLLKAVKGYAVLLDKVNATITSEMKNVKVNSIRHALKVSDKGNATAVEKRQRRIMADTAFAYAHTFIPFISRSVGHTADSGRALLKLAERTTSALKAES